MTGRLLEALRLVPPALWRHLGAQFEIDAPDLASLRTMYRRRRTLFEQQDPACSVLGFQDVTEAQRRALIRAINAELSRTSDRQRLLQFARRWLYDHEQIIPRERELRGYIAKAIRQHEATLVSEIVVDFIDLCPIRQQFMSISDVRCDLRRLCDVLGLRANIANLVTMLRVPTRPGNKPTMWSCHILTDDL